jgi:CTP synthase (UTP-ammonia lyase)
VGVVTSDPANDGGESVKRARIGIIGDFDAAKPSHIATDAALARAERETGAALDVVWVPTTAITVESADALLGRFDALWASPGSPYRNLEGALEGIRYARRRGKPLVAT